MCQQNDLFVQKDKRECLWVTSALLSWLPDPESVAPPFPGSMGLVQPSLSTGLGGKPSGDMQLCQPAGTQAQTVLPWTCRAVLILSLWKGRENK